MNSNAISQDKSFASLIHLSVFSKYFFPLGNFMLPLLLWMTKKEDPLVDANGRKALNFQISILLYTILIALLGILILLIAGINLSSPETFYIFELPLYLTNFQQLLPLFIIAIAFGCILLALFILEIYAVIKASLLAGRGEIYKYSLCISFIKETALTQ